MESSDGSRRDKSDRMVVTVVVVVVVVIVVIVAAAIISAVFFLTNFNPFSPHNYYSTDTNVTPAIDQNSLAIAAGNCSIDVDLASGNLIYINLTVSARTSLSSQNVYISVDSQSAGVQITLHTPSASSIFSSSGIIYIPASLNLTYLNLTTLNGNENINHPFNLTHLNMATANGNIGITNEVGAAGMTGGYVSASTTNGNININGTGFNGISAKTSNGNVHITIPGNIISGNFTISTTNGNLALFLGNMSQASFYLSTVNGGITTSGLNIQITTSSSHTFNGTLNGGGATVNMKTTNGNIAVTGVT